MARADETLVFVPVVGRPDIEALLGESEFRYDWVYEPEYRGDLPYVRQGGAAIVEVDLDGDGRFELFIKFLNPILCVKKGCLAHVLKQVDTDRRSRWESICAFVAGKGVTILDRRDHGLRGFVGAGGQRFRWDMGGLIGGDEDLTIVHIPRCRTGTVL